MAGRAVKKCVCPPASWDHPGLVWPGPRGCRTGAAAIFSVGHRRGCPVFSGAARVCPAGRAERALAAPGVAGQALLPGREDAPAGFGLLASLREGRGCGGSAPAVLACPGGLAAGRGDGGFLAAPVGLTVEDQLSLGRLE